MLSSAYRQSSALDETKARADLKNTLWSRFPTRRLDAESLRDAMLATSGALDLRVAGPPAPLKVAADGQFLPDPASADANRRSLYLFLKFREPVHFLGVFDLPVTPSKSVAERGVSLSVRQSLALWNNPFVMEQAQRLAARVTQEAGARDAAKITRAFRLAYGRAPAADELSSATQFLGKDRDALTELCRVLLASNEFLYLN